MKRIVIFLAIVGLCHLNTFSQKKYEMVVEKTDGTETVFNVEDIVRTYFRERSGGDASYTSCPDNNHPHWIDLGLPSGTLWQCSNVGANTPEGYGGYWSSTPSVEGRACGLYFNSYYAYWSGSGYRFLEHSVRPLR